MNNSTSTTEQLNKLTALRQAAYDCLGPARDALFELGDAVLLTPSVRSLAELSLAPVFRRRWPSVYAAVGDGQIDRSKLLRHYVEHLPKREPE